MAWLRARLIRPEQGLSDSLSFIFSKKFLKNEAYHEKTVVSPGQERESEESIAMMGCGQAGITKLKATVSRGTGCTLHSPGSPTPSLSESADL